MDVALVGPTASGKSATALAAARLARSEGVEVELVSVDSMAVYRGMDVGTAKPTREELARVRHHLVDIREVSEPMNVASYASMAREAAEEIHARGRRVLVVGGSGFYLRSYFAAVADSLEVAPELRAALEARLAAEGLPALVRELDRLNPGGLGALDTDNPRRVCAALGRCLASGRTLADLAAEFARAPRPFEGWEVRLCRIDLPEGALGPRIEARVSSMLAAGLVAEVERLLASGLRRNPSALRAIGYRETVDVLEGRLPLAQLAARISQDTRGLVKKQRTWFRTQLPAHPALDAGDPELFRRLFA